MLTTLCQLGIGYVELIMLSTIFLDYFEVVKNYSFDNFLVTVSIRYTFYLYPVLQFMFQKLPRAKLAVKPQTLPPGRK